MELAELLPPGVELDDDLVVWARRHAEDLLQGQDVDAVLAALGAEASGFVARSSVAAAAAPAPRARAMTPPPLPASAGAAPRARAMTPMPPPPPRARAVTPVPPPPPSLAGTAGADVPQLERVATTLATDEATTLVVAARDEAADDMQDVDDVELMEVDADELELVEDASEQEESESDEHVPADDSLETERARDVADEPSLFDDGEVTPGASLADEPLPDDQKTSIALAPHLREPSGPMAAAEVREDTNRFALPEDQQDPASSHDASALADDGIDSGILDVDSQRVGEQARQRSASTADMVLDDVDPSAFGLGFDAEPQRAGSAPSEAEARPVRTGGTQRLTSVDAAIEDGLDDDDDDIDIDLD